MKTVYFVRHGETEGNTGKIFQGEDTALTEHGREQAHIVADRCAKLSFNVMLSSPARRARETAEIIKEKTGMSFEISDLFTERRRPSSLMGRSADDADAQKLEEIWAQGSFGDGPRVLDGEHFDDLKARAGTALAYLEQHPAHTILVVTHGFFLRTLMARVILGEQLTSAEFKRIMFSFSTDNTGISMFRHAHSPKSGETRWKIRVFNDHAHLG